MVSPPFDSSRYDESNELCYIIFQSLDDEIMSPNGLKNDRPETFGR